jgi:hypothetical protein
MSVPVTPAMYPAATLFQTDRLEHTDDDDGGNDDDDDDDGASPRLAVAVVVDENMTVRMSSFSYNDHALRSLDSRRLKCL